jgi:predicted short-subunit dehydrogenase-like oxidoreductase (DUF2520 family)
VSGRHAIGSAAPPAGGDAHEVGPTLRPAPSRSTVGLRVGIVGPGRAGLGLALALRRARVPVLGVHGRREKAMPRGIALTVGPVPPWLAAVDVVILAVGDDALAPLVADLAEDGAIHGGLVALHLSGARTSSVLAPLSARGAAIGSMHPLMTVGIEPTRAARHFRGAAFALEGDVAAVLAADALVRALGGVPVMIAPEAKAAYHAGAVFASNYLVTALATAERLLASAGMPPDVARGALMPLARATLDHVAALGPEAALTGPIARGDAATVRGHREALEPEVRRLYDALARATLALAKGKGLTPAAQAALVAALAEWP